MKKVYSRVFTSELHSNETLDVLEYIHSNEYIHADIKGSNLLLGITKQTQNTVFLVDFGLACRYTQKEFKPDPKKAHNGTIEYTSRDAHDGVATRRGDLEILAYNMIHWAGCTLPWEGIINDPATVQSSKKKYMDDVPSFLKTCFGKEKIPSALKEFVEYVSKMQYNTEPDYKKCRKILLKGLKECGGKLTDKLDFSSSDRKHKSENDVSISDNTPEKKRKVSPKRNPRSKKSKETLSDSEVDVSPVRKSKTPKKDLMENATAEMLRIKQKIEERKNAMKKTTRRKKINVKNDDDSDIENDDIIQATPPETYARKRKTVKKPEQNGDMDSDNDNTRRTLRHRK